MPIGVYYRTNTHKENMSLAAIKRCTPEWRTERSRLMTGKKLPCSEETKLKISVATKGKNKGNIAWNKGLTKETDQRVAENGLATGRSKKGKPSPMLGKTHSENTKRIIGEKNKLVWDNPEYKNKMSEIKKSNPIRYWLGKKRPSPSEETRKKMSEAQKRIGNMPPVRCGKLNNKWKGGITSEDKKLRSKFRQEMQHKIFERDNYVCQICNCEGGKLQVDHIKSWAEYPESRFEESNCRTLCMACHYYITFKRIIPHNNMVWGHNMSKKGCAL